MQSRIRQLSILPVFRSTEYRPQPGPDLPKFIRKLAFQDTTIVISEKERKFSGKKRKKAI